MEKRLFIGTSGWIYKDWKGVFYPEDLKKGEELNYYSKFFNTTEINSTFYRLPFENMVKGWYRKTPPQFSFAIKVSRKVTHIQRLKDCKEILDDFFQRLSLLKEKASIFLYQLPPSLKLDLELLKDFLEILPPEHRHVIEFRNKSWFVDNTYSLLKEKNVGFCIVSAPKLDTILEATSDFVYIRMHGKEGWYRYFYSDEELKWWSDVINRFLEEGKTVFCYFNNDYQGNAVKNATKLKELLKDVSRETS